MGVISNFFSKRVELKKTEGYNELESRIETLQASINDLSDKLTKLNETINEVSEARERLADDLLRLSDVNSTRFRIIDRKISEISKL